MKKTLSTATLAAVVAATAFAGYLQHVAVDVSDSRQNFPLRVARGEIVDLSVDFSDEGEPLDISGSEVVLHTRTNGMAAAESWQTSGTATNNSALFVLDVDAVLPQAAGQWSCVASRDGRTLARVGGTAYVRGTAAGTVAALPQNALSGYATTNYVNDAIGAIDVDETDPAWSAWADANTNRLGYVSHVEGAETALSAEYAEQAGSAIEAQTAGTATYADTAGFATNAADAQHAWNAETASTLLVGFSARDGEFFTERDGAVAQAATNYTDSATNALRQSLSSQLSLSSQAATNYTDSAVATRLSRAEAEAGFTEWTFQNTPPGMTNCSLLWYAASQDWVFQYSLNGTHDYDFISGAETSTNLSLVYNATATRTRLRPTAAMEAAWDAKADGDTVTNIVRDLSLGGIWDEQIQVWWTPRMRNGSLTYEATTNVNLNAEN